MGIELELGFWRNRRFAYSMDGIEELGNQNPQIGLAHATSSIEIREKVHANLVESRRLMNEEINSPEAIKEINAS